MQLPDDPIMVELIPEFVDTWINDLDTQMPVILKEKNEKELYRLGHTIKGSCLQFGFDDVSKLGIELMGYSKEQNWEKAAEMEPKLKQVFKEIKEFVEAELNK